MHSNKICRFIPLSFLSLLLLCSEILCLEIVDQAGRTVICPAEVKRVVTTYNPATNIVFALGGHRKLVSLSAYPHKYPLYQKLYPNPGYTSSIGSKKGVNIEAIFATHPDLVIIHPTKDGIETAAKITSLGVPALVIDPENLSKLRRSIRLVGQVLGMTAEANRLEEKMNSFVNIVESRLKQISTSNRKKVYFAASRGINTTSSAAMMQHTMIEMAGGVDVVQVTSGGWLNVSLEQLMLWNPDVILLSRTCRTTVKALMTEPRYSALKAVEKRQIFRFPSNLNPWDYPGPENYLAILWLSVKLYPDLFQDIVFADVVDDYYLSIYGRSFKDLGGVLEANGEN
ncbi:ABC transporter substrate-binding protein [candidate division CSSED10-310 bacterium]|uniref:ABC transporter substrate-binding protein n=1 Tax=candidate division CSSED10-310 bacterium TaxID=2855610 RepID=A0ABV6YY04_UNCC1